MYDVIDTTTFRSALGSFCSGVTVITGMSADDTPVGLACQSFSSLSLDPPLVLICLGKQSRSWAAIAETGRFTVNVLSQDQEHASRAFGSSTGRRFEAVEWQVREGAVVLDDVLAWIDCSIHAIHDGGDHHIIVGAVRRLAVERPTHQPLVFFRGAYGLNPNSAFWEWPTGAD